jgi:hypothetical protein
VYFLLKHHSHLTLAIRSEPLLAGRKRATASKIFGLGVDIHHTYIWPHFAPCARFSNANGLSHGWTGGVYIAAKPHWSIRTVAGGKKDKPSTGMLYEIKLQSPKIGMLLA